MSITSEKLIEFLEHELAVDVTDVADETPLFSTGIVDSFAVISLMTYLETEGGIRIDPDDVNIDNMDSIGRILEFVARVKV